VHAEGRFGRPKRPFSLRAVSMFLEAPMRLSLARPDINITPLIIDVIAAKGAGVVGIVTEGMRRGAAGS